MTYFYKIKGTLARKEGGDPPNTSEYVTIDKQGIVRHIKDGEIIEERSIEYPDDMSEYPKEEVKALRELYKSGMGLKITKEMLYPKYRKKITSKPKKRTIKKCKCK